MENEPIAEQVRPPSSAIRVSASVSSFAGGRSVMRNATTWLRGKLSDDVLCVPPRPLTV
jgi:hypothetical protein